MPRDASELDAVLAKVVQIQDGAAKAFTALGWPKGKKATVLALRANLRNSAKASHAAFYALRQADQFGFERAMKRWAELDVNWQSRMRELGALVCASDSPDAGSARKIAGRRSLSTIASSAVKATW